MFHKDLLTPQSTERSTRQRSLVPHPPLPVLKTRRPQPGDPTWAGHAGPARQPCPGTAATPPPRKGTFGLKRHFEQQTRADWFALIFLVFNTDQHSLQNAPAPPQQPASAQYCFRKCELDAQMSGLERNEMS